MPLVAAKCPNCGGNLEVEPSQEYWVCTFCKTKVITQDAINNYNIVNNNYIQNATFVNGKSEKELVLDGIAQIKLKHYEAAGNTFKELSKKNPRSWKGYYGEAISNYFVNNELSISPEEWSLCPDWLQSHKTIIQNLCELKKRLNYEMNSYVCHSEAEYTLRKLEEELNWRQERYTFYGKQVKGFYVEMLGSIIIACGCIVGGMFVNSFLSIVLYFFALVFGIITFLPISDTHNKMIIEDRKNEKYNIKFTLQNIVAAQKQREMEIAANQQAEYDRNQRIQTLNNQIWQLLQSVSYPTIEAYYLAVLENSVDM